MKFKWNKTYIGWGVTAFLVIIASMFVIMIFSASESISNLFNTIISAISPVLLGITFAYILNPLLKILEFPIFLTWGRKIFKGKEFSERKARSFSRAIALFLTVILVIAFLLFLLWLIIPRLFDSITTMIQNIPQYYDGIRSLLEKMLSSNTELRDTVLKGIESAITNFQTYLSTDLLASLGDYANSIFSGIVEFVESFFNVIVGLIISIYILAEKEKFSAQVKKLVYSMFSTERATKIIIKTKKIDKIFTGFISAKVIDSFIIGILCYVILSIVNFIVPMPYKELVSVFIGVTNIIPFFGPFIGAIPSAFLILTVNPWSCLIFLIIIVVLQQLDGNILGPKILGESTGLSGFWVLCSLLVFGSLFGFVGMLVGVPTFAAIYAAIKSSVSDKLDAKNITNNTDDFREIDYIDPETNKPILKPTKEEIEAEINCESKDKAK